MISPYKLNGIEEAVEQQEATANETFTLGEALVLTSGKLTKCPAATRPTFIGLKAVSAAPAGTMIPVIRVSGEVVYETTLSVASASIAAGAKYTLSAGADSITATTTNGVAEVVDWAGKAAGDLVRVRF